MGTIKKTLQYKENKMKITKIVTFDAGHRLMNHEFKCWNLHGHTYKLEVTISSPHGLAEGTGMVIDFKDLKQAINNVIEKFDHAMILNKHDNMVITFCIKQAYAHYLIDGEPTAENIALEIELLLNKQFAIMQLPPLTIERLILWETPTSFAEV